MIRVAIEEFVFKIVMIYKFYGRLIDRLDYGFGGNVLFCFVFVLVFVLICIIFVGFVWVFFPCLLLLCII